ncbi:MAG: replication initiator, partial [Nocardioides sp.]
KKQRFPKKQRRFPHRIAYIKLRKWAHMLGFGGHYTTKTRHYSTTYSELRNARNLWKQRHHMDTDVETTLLVGHYTYTGTGWRTHGDQMLANTHAAINRERRHTARDEYRQLADREEEESWIPIAS